MPASTAVTAPFGNRGGWGLRERTLEALAADEGVRRNRSALAVERATTVSGAPAGDGGVGRNRATLAVGGAASVSVVSVAVTASAGNRGARGLRGRALEALAGDGGVGRDRVALASGSANSGEQDMGVVCGRALCLPVDTACRRADDLGRASSFLNDALGVYLRARAEVVQSVSSSGSASLEHFATVSSHLLRQCHGSVPLSTSTAGSAIFAPHINTTVVNN